MDEAPPEDARACLQNLIEINTAFGGHTIVRKLLSEVSGEADRFTLLDVGAASGDSARLIGTLRPKASVVSLDQNEVNLASAPHPKILADAFRLPFSAGSFDYVFSSLFLHHFSDDQIVSLLTSFARTAKRAVLISDLERHILPYLFLPATQWLYKWHWITVYDGKLSVRAALSADELHQLASRAGLKNIQVKSHRPAFRLSLVGEV
jgi:ubiquinone/menaquinone biosynthesis C-methylase UbiE